MTVISLIENSYFPRDDKAWPDPMPLVRPLGDPADFPVEALGPILENAARGIHEVVQCPQAIGAASVLAAASLAAQAHVDVIFPATGRAIPTSLFMLTVAESGERKSAADHEALAAVRAYERALSEEYSQAYGPYRNALEAREAARSAIKRSAKGADWQTVKDKLDAMGDDPKPPRKPHLVVSEPTYEALAKLFAEGQPSLGLFAPEGGAFLGGHAMRDESKLRALTGLSELWDGSALRRTRAGDGALQLSGRRLALHLMVQPSVAPLLLGDGVANGQGFLSRLLVCAPASTQGSRFQRTAPEWARPSIEAYNARIGEMLRRKPRLLEDGGLDPHALMLTPSASARWCAFADDMERGLTEDGLASSTRGLRNKTPELALRIAGVLAAAEEKGEVSQALLERGIAVAGYFLGEAKRLYDTAALKPEISRAMKLLRWLLKRGGGPISLRDIQLKGPASMQDAATVKEAVKILEEHNLCRLETVETGGRPSRRLVVSPLAKSVLQH
jgi:hypothetical protein